METGYCHVLGIKTHDKNCMKWRCLWELVWVRRDNGAELSGSVHNFAWLRDEIVSPSTQVALGINFCNAFVICCWALRVLWFWMPSSLVVGRGLVRLRFEVI